MSRSSETKSLLEEPHIGSINHQGKENLDRENRIILQLESLKQEIRKITTMDYGSAGVSAKNIYMHGWHWLLQRH